MLYKGYEVWITCEGQNIPEYGATLEGGDGKTLACFIPSESGKSFAIHFRNGSSQDSASLMFKVDGSKLAHGVLCHPGKSGNKKGVRTSLDVERPFQFASLKTSDDDELLHRAFNHADVGAIEVDVQRVHAVGRPVPVTLESFSGVGAVHERSKKAGAHSVGLGAGSFVRPYTQMMCNDPIDPFEGIFATFIFRYRPRDLLQAQGIMPPDRPKAEAGPSSSNVKQEKKRAGSPQQHDVKRARVGSASASGSGTVKRDLGVVEIVSDDEEDVNVLQRRLRKLQSQVDRARKKSGRVKAEPGIPVEDDGDVIDLTLDD